MKAKRTLCALLSVTLCLGLSACKEEPLEPVSVQSVGMITGIGSVGGVDRFSGVVDAGETVKVEKDSQLQVKELLVSAGDQVEEGQPLFTYDVEALSLDLDKLDLELQQMKAALTTKTQQKADLEKEKEKAKDEEKLSYTLQIQELQIDLTETELKITAKEKEIDRMKALLENDRVLSPVSGRIKEIKESSSSGYDDYGYGYGYGGEDGDSNAFITILQTETYRIKGTVNEMNANDLQPGMPVTICSRLDDTVWTGCVENVDWDNPVKDNNDYFYGGGGSDEMQTTSKYPFYVTLDNDEGLKLGQHVYIEPGLHTERDDRLMLPAWCINDADGSEPWVWAVDGSEKLEKRTLKLGAYDAEKDSYEVLSGISLQDYLAADDVSCKEGAPVTYHSESDFDAPDIPIDFGGFGEENGGEIDFENGEIGGMVGFEGGEYDFGDGEGGFADGEGGFENGETVPAEDDVIAPTEEGGAA